MSKSYLPMLPISMWSIMPGGHTTYGEMANFIPRDLDDLADEVAVSMLRKHQRPDLLRAFFQHARLDL
jgi:hypothetical protein